MTDYVHKWWDHNGIEFTFTWLDKSEIVPDRVYAFAFTPNQQMLLVTDYQSNEKYWLPGGGIEAGETPAQALHRELLEEANAEIVKLQYFGTQLAENTVGEKGYHAYYWCRIQVNAEFHPQHEVTIRHFVEPEDFLDTLFWGRQDPKSPMLLQRALEIENRYNRELQD